MEDWRLIREFVDHGSETAFSRLLERHMRFVYNVCLREVGDPHLAEDAVQVVFVLLARKAPALHRNTVLTGWLFQTARFAAKNIRKQKMRQERLERKVAEEMASATVVNQESSWESLEPHLHDALASLNVNDRNAVLLRYFEQYSIAETAAALGVAEDTARMRVARAIEKLRGYLSRHGIALSAAGLAAFAAERAADASPMLPASIVSQTILETAANLSHAQLSTATVAGLAKGVLKAMLINQIKAVTIGVCIGLAALGTGSIVGVHAFRGEGRVARAKVLAAAPSPDTSPQALLKRVRDHYQSLASFSMSVTHNDRSGLYPGTYTQILHWRQGGRFSLVAQSQGKRPRNGLKINGVMAFYPPRSFIASGGAIITIRDDDSIRTEILVSRPNIVPGWEVSGGVILSWLQRNRIVDWLYGEGPPPTGITPSWTFGPRTTWHGHSCREVVVKMAATQSTTDASLFIDEKALALLGTESKLSVSGKPGWESYDNQQFNPKLDDLN